MSCKFVSRQYFFPLRPKSFMSLARPTLYAILEIILSIWAQTKLRLSSEWYHVVIFWSWLGTWRLWCFCMSALYVLTCLQKVLLCYLQDTISVSCRYTAVCCICGAMFSTVSWHVLDCIKLPECCAHPARRKLYHNKQTFIESEKTFGNPIHLSIPILQT